MTRLEDVKGGVTVSGLAPDGLAEVVSVEWFGDQAMQVVYRDGGGVLRDRLLYRYDEPSLEITTTARGRSFDGDGALLRLVSEAPPTGVGRDAGRIADEVLSHLATVPGARLRISMEIEAEMPGGASEDVQRTVSENSNQLKFDSHGFERE